MIPPSQNKGGGSLFGEPLRSNARVLAGKDVSTNKQIASRLRRAQFATMQIKKITCYDEQAVAAIKPTVVAIQEMDSSHLIKVFGENAWHNSADGLGDCHEVAMAFMTDLIKLGRQAGWTMISADILYQNGGYGRHSWLEFADWAIDASNGDFRIVRARDYSAALKARKIVRRNARQLRRWADRIHRKESYEGAEP